MGDDVACQIFVVAGRGFAESSHATRPAAISRAREFGDDAKVICITYAGEASARQVVWPEVGPLLDFDEEVY